MKIRYRTKNGLVILSVPDGFPVDADAAKAAAQSLDQMGSAFKAGSARVSWHDDKGKNIGFMSWTSDKRAKK